MTPAQLEQLGLPEDASEDDINAKLAEAAAALAAQNSDTPPEGDGDGEGEGANQGAGETAPGTQTQEEQQPTTPLPGSPPVTIPQQEGGEGAQAQLPDNVVPVDRAAWESMQAQLAAATALVEKNRVQERDDFLAKAQAKGEFTKASADIYREMYDDNAERARTLIDRMPENVVPVNEIGYGDTQDAVADDAYDMSVLTPAERERINNFYAQQGA